MGALEVELRTAMAAIAGNALIDFEESVRRQEALCIRLTAMAGAAFKLIPGRGMELGQDDLRRAAEVLESTNRDYRALLRHSGRSIELLSLLTNGYTGHRKEARNAGSTYGTWNCEM